MLHSQILSVLSKIHLLIFRLIAWLIQFLLKKAFGVSLKIGKFIEKNRADLCASIQHAIIDALILQLQNASIDLKINEIAVAGGVSANSELRKRLKAKEEDGWIVHLPKFEYCTDNGAMIAMAGQFLYEKQEWGNLESAPNPRMKF